MKAKKYYAYFVPTDRISGVTDNWPDCDKKVSGKFGARYRAFKAREDAEEWLRLGARYETKKTKAGVYPHTQSRLGVGVYFDAGTGRGEGVEISVTDESGKNLLHEAVPQKLLNRFGKHLLHSAATNNYGELSAMKHALEIAKKKKIKRIFGDSKLVLDYWSRGIFNRKNIPPETAELAEAVAKMRKNFEKNGGKIARVSGGDNPADLGFHRG